MANYNKVVLVGNVTRDPEIRYVGVDKIPVCEVGLAVRNQFSKEDKVTFVDVNFWRKTAEVAGRFVRKGSCILVDGRLEMDSWEKDGQKRTKLYVEAETMQLLDKKGSNNNSSDSIDDSSDVTDSQDLVSAGDIPF